MGNKNIILIFVAILVAAGILYLASQREPTNPVLKGPKIQVETTEYDFGDIPQQEQKRVLWVKNTGKQPLQIVKVSTSCGCTKGEIDKNTINPGESANLTITFDPNLMGEIGPVEKVVYIRSNDPANEELAITVKTNVVPQTTPSPSPAPNQTFKCPKSEPGSYINCMPGPDMPLEKQKICSGDYHEWIKANCPDVKFTY